MGPTDVIYGLLTLAFGGGLGAFWKSRADARSINAKRGPEVESINVATLRSTIDGQQTLVAGLQATNAALREENASLRAEGERQAKRLQEMQDTVDHLRTELDRLQDEIAQMLESSDPSAHT